MMVSPPQIAHHFVPFPTCIQTSQGAWNGNTITHVMSQKLWETKFLSTKNVSNQYSKLELRPWRSSTTYIRATLISNIFREGGISLCLPSQIEHLSNQLIKHFETVLSFRNTRSVSSQKLKLDSTLQTALENILSDFRAIPVFSAALFSKKRRWNVQSVGMATLLSIPAYHIDIGFFTNSSWPTILVIFQLVHITKITLKPALPNIKIQQANHPKGGPTSPFTNPTRFGLWFPAKWSPATHPAFRVVVNRRWILVFDTKEICWN